MARVLTSKSRNPKVKDREQEKRIFLLKQDGLLMALFLSINQWTDFFILRTCILDGR
jgi:hypothetical protein